MAKIPVANQFHEITANALLELKDPRVFYRVDSS